MILCTLPLGVLEIALACEKLTKHRSAFRGPDLRKYLDPVVETSFAQNIKHRAYGPCLFVPRAHDQARDASEQGRPGAHRARFEGDDERAVIQAPPAQMGGGFAKGNDFSVGHGVAVGLTAVISTPHDLARRIHDDCADGYICGGFRFSGLGQGQSHPLVVELWKVRHGYILCGSLGAMRVKILDHPLVTHKITVLRDRETTSPQFRQLVDELVTLLAYEATRKIRVEPKTVQTPVAQAEGSVIAKPRPLVVPILRAGLGMLEGMTRLIPTAEVGFLGMARHEKTLDIVTYAERLPDDLTGRQVYVLDPMLATGGTLIEAIKFLRNRGADQITCLCILGAPEGLAALERGVEGMENVDVFLAARDEKLDENAYIVPGLGDAGDRLYGVVD